MVINQLNENVRNSIANAANKAYGHIAKSDEAQDKTDSSKSNSNQNVPPIQSIQIDNEENLSN